MVSPSVHEVPTPPRHCPWHSVGRHGGPCPACMRYRKLRLEAQNRQAEQACQESLPVWRLIMAGAGA